MFSALVLSLLVSAPAPDEVVTVPLSEWTKQRAELARLEKEGLKGLVARPVVVGETIYRGHSDGRNLHLSLSLRAQLADTNTFKDVAVIGRDAVILSAKHKGQPIALVPSGEHWVWTTKEKGAVELDVDIVIPPRGPRGSIEYRFGVVESPVTELVAFFPTPDLSPQVSGAVTNQVRSVRGGTELSAVLTPATEIHVVGFHDVADNEGGQEAKLYGETQSLVSINDDGVELFSVVNLAILYAPQKRFRIELPKGFELVSADGEGAFQFALENEGERTILVGETAFGITHRYEISLRLERPLSNNETSAALPVPRLLDVERDSGFVAIEIPGKISIASVEGDDFTSIDVRELPEAILRSSVSPVVRAFRYSGARKDATIALARHPEKPLAAGGVDVLKATSVVTGDGRVMTDLLFTIRNNLQQYLSLELPSGAEVRSAVLDGDPIKPSRDASGRVLVPLRRSKVGPSGLVAFRVQLVYESEIGELGALGRRALALPKLTVPVASVEWSMFVPGTYTTTSLVGPIGKQTFIKNARWHRGLDDGEDAEYEDNTDAEESGGDYAETEEPAEADAEANQPAAAPATHADRASGAMPVRVQIPRDGTELETRRFWVDANDPMTATLYYARTPLPMLGGAFAVVTMALMLAGGLAARRPTRIGAGVAIGAAIAAAWSLKAALLGAAFAVAAAIIASGRAKALRTSAAGAATKLYEATRTKIAGSLRELIAEFEERRKKSLLLALALPGARFAWIGAKLFALAILATILLVELDRLIDLLKNPL